MEHHNPLLQMDSESQKFITFGEIMLRLTPPNYEKIRMATNFEASYGGSEANIAIGAGQPGGRQHLLQCCAQQQSGQKLQCVCCAATMSTAPR